ncbi:MAG: hypothetical protein SGJ03_00245 [Alphaproteobacteria bacterium]|nr:hypothetical protein [Alphaproteobacteria bacterium]
MLYYRTPRERREKEAFVKANTAKVGFWYRIWLRVAVRRSIRTGGESHSKFKRVYGLVSPEFKLGPRFSKTFGKHPSRFGDDVAHFGLQGKLGERLTQFKEGLTSAPFLVIRDLLPICHLPTIYSAKMTSPKFNHGKPRMTRQKWYLKKSYYDLIGSGLLSELGAHHRSRTFTEEAAYRDYFTAPGAEVDQFARDEDVPRRWRQAVPEFALVDEPSATSGAVTARYAVYFCVENPIQDPFWVLPVHHVIDALSESERAMLRHVAYEFFDHWNDDLSSRGLSSIQKILGGEKVKLTPGQNQHYNKWMSFDANRLNLESGKTQQEERAAVGSLHRTLMAVAEEHAVPIMLKAGDVLVVDNYRTLIRRTELGFRSFNAWTLGRPAVRWLRMYCGFPPTPTSARASAGGETVHLAAGGAGGDVLYVGKAANLKKRVQAYTKPFDQPGTIEWGRERNRT